MKIIIFTLIIAFALSACAVRMEDDSPGYWGGISYGIGGGYHHFHHH
jgi:hypothetical protein